MEKEGRALAAGKMEAVGIFNKSKAWWGRKSHWRGLRKETEAMSLHNSQEVLLKRDQRINVEAGGGTQGRGRVILFL